MKRFNISLITICLIIFLGVLWLKKSESKFLTKKPESFSFIVVGHVYSQYEALEDAIKQAEKEKAVFIIITGDLINNSSKSLEEDWQDFEKLMAQVDIPFYIAPGNHDVDNEEKRKVFEERFGSLPYSFVYKNSKFLLLDSCDLGKDCKQDIGQEQLDFLKTEYQDPWESEHIFLFIHHPLWLEDFSLTYGKYYDNSWEQEVHPLIKEKSKYVFAGDSFTYFYTQKDGVYYFVNGFASKATKKPPYFLQVKVSGKDVKVEMKTALSNAPSTNAQSEIYFLEEKHK